MIGHTELFGAVLEWAGRVAAPTFGLLGFGAVAMAFSVSWIGVSLFNRAMRK